MNSDIVDEDFRLKMEEMLSEKRYNRFRKGVESDIDIYPTFKGGYVVYSRSSGNKYYIQYTDEKYRCSCQDYFIRVENSSELHRCKHVWRLWLEINENLLPPATEEPFNWIKSHVENDILNLISTEDEEEKQKLNKLKNIRQEIKSSNPRNADYEKLYRLWKQYKS